MKCKQLYVYIYIYIVLPPKLCNLIFHKDCQLCPRTCDSINPIRLLHVCSYVMYLSIVWAQVHVSNHLHLKLHYFGSNRLLYISMCLNIKSLWAEGMLIHACSRIQKCTTHLSEQCLHQTQVFLISLPQVIWLEDV